MGLDCLWENHGELWGRGSKGFCAGIRILSSIFSIREEYRIDTCHLR